MRRESAVDKQACQLARAGVWILPLTEDVIDTVVGIPVGESFIGFTYLFPKLLVKLKVVAAGDWIIYAETDYFGGVGTQGAVASRKPMEHVLIIHAVQDYAAWKRVFDDAAAIRKEAGERRYQVLRDENDPNKIVHFSEWISLAQAKAFFESPRLVEIRRQAGVEAPEFIYLHQLASGVL